MNWREKAKKEKEERIKKEEIKTRLAMYVRESGLLKLINEVRSEIEEETDHWYRIAAEGPHDFKWANGRVPYASEKHFTIRCEPDGIFLIIENDEPIQINPRRITKSDIYRWFERISK